MARSRNIKPGFFTNADLAACSALARIIFAGLWTIADKAGRLRDRPKQLKGELLPYDDCDVDALLNELATGPEPFIRRYSLEGVAYIQVVNWDKHQSPHHTERDSVIPPFDNRECTVRARRALNQESGINEEGIRDQESAPPSKKQKRDAFVPPTVNEVRAFCQDRGNTVNAKTFVNHYKSNGWMVGRVKMKDWRATVEKWEDNDFSSNRKTRSDPRGVGAAANAYLTTESKNGG